MFRQLRTAWPLLALLFCWPAVARAQVVSLDAPLPFHGAELVGFEKGAALGTETRLWRPSEPTLMFLTLKLKLSGPFEYTRGRFREITITDENAHVYRYRGWLTDDGWMDLDAPGQGGDDLGVMGAQEYPAILDLHFEVPKNARALVLHYGDATSMLFSN